MGRVPKPSPALVVAIISLVVAIGGTAAALPGKFTVGRDDLKNDSVGARALGRSILGYSKTVSSTDTVANDGNFTEFRGAVVCPKKAPFAYDPSVSGLGPIAYEVRAFALGNGDGGPGGYQMVLTSDEGPGVFHSLTVNCLPSR